MHTAVAALYTPNVSPGRCEVTHLLRQLCTTDVPCGRNERVTGAKNAQLLCINGSSTPRAPSTPQLLKILEETIKKKAPKPLLQKPIASNDVDRFRMQFNISEKTAENLFQYRTKFVQHMLSSPMYANSAVGKPWEMIGSITEQIIDELLLGCAKELELHQVIEDLYRSETK
ncbi:hypothetical protein K1T71_008047 [Dendrolimus kikuchii]|uniref:Uncharacterized protein n=1 Tax=Dendrolimus kikuchii TaxID=765133 RepID=A0ACC1CYZ8_9NEOP|nr:hypothetical protein K1T71_008047 [Dendrolimus kikuchii]